jgi:hypothetical protein
MLYLSILFHWCSICSYISVRNSTQYNSQSLLYLKMSLKSHSIAICFGLTRPSSGNYSLIETAALHQFVCQCIPCYYISSSAIKCVCLRMNTLSELFSFYVPFVCSSHYLAVCSSYISILATMTLEEKGEKEGRYLRNEQFLGRIGPFLIE